MPPLLRSLLVALRQSRRLLVQIPRFWEQIGYAGSPPLGVLFLLRVKSRVVSDMAPRLPNIPVQEGRTALHWAALRKDADTLEFLVKKIDSKVRRQRLRLLRRDDYSLPCT
jgi:ankyrin repeat protein